MRLAKLAEINAAALSIDGVCSWLFCHSCMTIADMPASFGSVGDTYGMRTGSNRRNHTTPRQPMGFACRWRRESQQVGVLLQQQQLLQRSPWHQCVQPRLQDLGVKAAAASVL